jgi:DNA polymerase-3 subunit gamma/tau
MSYQVLARKWRPANFKQMVGQEHVLQALGNALDSQRLHHAYLFSGTRGVGKTTIARIFAKSLNCEQGISSEPCGQCSSCNEIDQGRSLDLIEIDAASRTGVDDMRELLDNVQYAPTRSRFKIYLIDEVHMLSKPSFNALLKTLEEPPPHIKFLLATTDPQKLPVTVLSRCLQFNLKRMSRAQILSQLKYLTEQEQIEADDDALAQLASAADGSMRDALSLLDQAIGYGGGAVRQQAVESMLGSISREYLKRLLDALAGQQATALVIEARQIIEHNPDYQRVCAEMISLLQQVALYQTDPQLVIEGEFGEELLQTYAQCWSVEEVQLYYQILLQGRQDLLISPDEAAGFEMLMLRLIAFSPEPELTGDSAEVKKKPELRPVEQVPSNGERDSEGPVLRPSEASASETSVPATAAIASAAPPDEAATAEPSLAPQVEATAVLDTELTEISAAPVEEPPECGKDVNATARAGFDWLTLAYDLGLNGIAQELVANSELVNHTDNEVELALPRELHELVNDVTRSEISRALQQKLGVSWRLLMTASDRPGGTTPLLAKQERLRLERLAAIAAIREETLVKKLQHAFAAELDEASVVKIKGK